jgi:type I restriction enzyme S subunit
MTNKWPIVEIKDIAHVKRGASPRPISDSKYFASEGRGWIRIADVTRTYKYLNNTSQYLSGLGEQASVRVDPNDLIMSICATVGKPVLVGIPACIHDGFVVFRDIDGSKLTKEYFFYQLLLLEDKWKIKGQTGSQMNLNTTLVEHTKIVLPPLIIQQKIGDILASIDEAIQKSDQIIQKSEELKQGLMQNILNFGSKDDVRYLALGDIGKVSMCKRIFKNETSNVGDIPFYKIGTFGKEPDAFISKELYDTYRNKYPYPKIGDVLLSASGTIGRKVKYDGKPAYFQDSNIVWLEHDESIILNNFLYYLYETINWQTEGSTIKRLYNDILLRKVVPVPPVDKQRQLLKILSAVDEKITINKKLKVRIIFLKKGLMNDIFNQKVQIN